MHGHQGTSNSLACLWSHAVFAELQVEVLTGQLADMQREVEDKGRLSSTLEATERSRKQVWQPKSVSGWAPSWYTTALF